MVDLVWMWICLYWKQLAIIYPKNTEKLKNEVDDLLIDLRLCVKFVDKVSY